MFQPVLWAFPKSAHGVVTFLYISWGPWPFDPLMAFASMVPRTNLAIEPLQKNTKIINCEQYNHMTFVGEIGEVTKQQRSNHSTLAAPKPCCVSSRLAVSPGQVLSTLTSGFHKASLAQPVPKPRFLQCTNLKGAGQRMGRSTSFSPCQQFVTFNHGTRQISPQNPSTIAILMLFFFFMETIYTYSHGVN